MSDMLNNDMTDAEVDAEINEISWREQVVQSVAGATMPSDWQDEDDWAREEASYIEARARKVHVLRVCIELIEANPLIPLPSIASNAGTKHWTELDLIKETKLGDKAWQQDYSWVDDAIAIGCHSAAEMKAVIATLSSNKSPGVKDTDTYWGAAMRFTYKGIAFKAYRADQTCEMVPEVDAEGNEVTEEVTTCEEIAPARVREVVKTVPKMRRVCPPLIAD